MTVFCDCFYSDQHEHDIVLFEMSLAEIWHGRNCHRNVDWVAVDDAFKHSVNTATRTEDQSSVLDSTSPQCMSLYLKV